MKTLVTSKNHTYYVGKKSGKNFTYTEVKAETLVTVDKNGKFAVKTTVGGKALAASTVLYEATEDGFRKCKVEDVDFTVTWSLYGNRIEDVTSTIGISDSGIATIEGNDIDGNTVEHNLPAGTYGIRRFDVDNYCAPVIDLDIPMDKDFHPDGWDEFIANKPERILPKAGPEKKALEILKTAFDKVKAMGLEVVIGDDDNMFVVPEDADWELYETDDAGDDLVEVPMKAFNSINTGIRHISTDNNEYMYLNPVKSGDEHDCAES